MVPVVRCDGPRGSETLRCDVGVIEECGMLVDELRHDPAFDLLLYRLHDCIGRALRSAHPTLKQERYAELSRWLVELMERLKAQR